MSVYTRLCRGVFLAAAHKCKRLGIPLTGHVPLAITAAKASDAERRSIEHAYRLRMLCATAEDEIERLQRDLITVDDQRSTTNAALPSKTRR